MKKLAEFIVKKRLLFFILFAGLAVYCIFGIPRVKVEYDISSYLPAHTDTTRALAIMDSEFQSSGSATVLLKDIRNDDAQALCARIGQIPGVTNASIEYKSGSALLSVYYSGDKFDAAAVAAYDKTVQLIKDSGCDYSVPTPLTDSYADTLAGEMVIIIAIAAAVIFVVLFVTSKSFAEVLAFPVVFLMAGLLNMGTNYWLGTISFVSNTVCIILQLALAIDYAIILCHRFTEEKEKCPDNAQQALINALTNAIPEIASSSLTTVSGLVALMFMQLGLGFDLGMVLAKSIICSLVTVFFLMPGILLLLSKLMDKSRHRSFVPKVRFLGRGAVKARYVFIALFVAAVGVGAWLSQNVDYCYSQSSIDTSHPSAQMNAQREAESIFGSSNAFVILVPKTEDYDTQRAVMAAVETTVSRRLGEGKLRSALGWAGITLPSRSDPQRSYYLTDSINYLELSDIAGVAPGSAALVFALYAAERGQLPDDYASYRVPADEVFAFVLSNNTLRGMAGSDLLALEGTLSFARGQLVGSDHMRLVFTVDMPLESEETFAFIDELTPPVKRICPGAIFAGASMSAYDLNASFSHDNILISLLTVAFVFLILAITFRSWGIPIALVAVIQGAIFINFSLPVIMGHNLFFFIYLIVSAIQMGATIDYAILMTNRFRRMRETMPKGKATVEAVSAAFPTILTSGTIMTVASFLVGLLVSDPLISSMGMTLGKGTLISVICVLTALPALLYTLDSLLEKSVIGRKKRKKASEIKMPNPSSIPFAE